MSYHLIKQLELLPNWPQLACQRVGDYGGPTSIEFELTTAELDWYAALLGCEDCLKPEAIG
jgi:hypothetical protein